MSCTNCGNGNSNCSCSDNCPNKTSDITLFDGVFNVLEIPCDASLNDVLTLLETYTTNMVNELSGMTSVTVGSNCIGLAAGIYSIQQIYAAVNSAICSLDTRVSDLESANQLFVKINAPIGGLLTSSVSGGVAPYTYLWEMQDDLNGIQLDGSTTADEMTISNSKGVSTYPFGLVKLTVTDDNGNKASDTFLKQALI